MIGISQEHERMEEWASRKHLSSFGNETDQTPKQQEIHSIDFITVVSRKCPPPPAFLAQSLAEVFLSRT